MLHGEPASWQANEHLLANIVDLLNAANWQRGGNKNAPQPEPIERPGDRERKSAGRSKVLNKLKALGGTSPNKTQH